MFSFNYNFIKENYASLSKNHCVSVLKTCAPKSHENIIILQKTFSTQKQAAIIKEHLDIYLETNWFT